MKFGKAVFWPLLFQVGVRADNFGPGGCVSVNRSDKGNCLIKTSCTGQDIKAFEFAFTCTLPEDGGVEKHSYGLGGFAANEEYDTEVQCKACHAPPDAIVAQSAAAAPAELTTAVKRKAAAPAAEAATTRKVVAYGPGQCVSTYKSESGTCIVQTECTEAQIENYEFGMVCAEADGTLSRHLFGKGAFAPTETFDTLIECKQCMGLEDVAADGALVTEVQALRTDLAAMKTDLQGLNAQVKTISDTVAKDEAAAAKGAAKDDAAAKKAAGAAAYFLVKKDHTKKSEEPAAGDLSFADQDKEVQDTRDEEDQDEGDQDQDKEFHDTEDEEDQDEELEEENGDEDANTQTKDDDDN